MGRMISNCIECGQEVFDAERCTNAENCNAYKRGHKQGVIDGLDRAHRLLETKVVNEYRNLILNEKARLSGRHLCGLQGYDPMQDPPCPACKTARS